MATTTADINGQSKACTPDRDHIEEFTNVVTRCLPVFYRMALRRLGNVADVEDAVQDALLSAYRFGPVQGVGEDSSVWRWNI